MDIVKTKNSNFSFMVYREISQDGICYFNIFLGGIKIFSIVFFQEKYVVTEIGMGQVFYENECDRPSSSTLETLLEILNKKLILFNDAFQKKMIISAS